MTEPDTREVRIYRSTRRPETYLYVDAAEDLARVPEPLLQGFGRPVVAMVLSLWPARRLAHADAARVLRNIVADGFYLQLPPEPRPESAERFGRGT